MRLKERKNIVKNLLKKIDKEKERKKVNYYYFFQQKQKHIYKAIITKKQK